MVLLAVVILLDVVAVVSDYAEISLVSRMMSGERITLEEAEANDNRQAAIGMLQLAAFIATAVAFLAWIHRAHKNLTALGASHLKYSPGWAVGWFFVPFLNLVRPFQVVTEIWKASDPEFTDGQSWHKAPSSPLIGCWWALYLVSGLVGYILVQMVFTSEETLSDLLTTSRVMLAADAIEIPGAILAILLIKAIDARQAQKNWRLTPGESA